MPRRRTYERGDAATVPFQAPSATDAYNAAARRAYRAIPDLNAAVNASQRARMADPDVREARNAREHRPTHYQHPSRGELLIESVECRDVCTIVIFVDDADVHICHRILHPSAISSAAIDTHLDELVVEGCAQSRREASEIERQHC